MKSSCWSSPLRMTCPPWIAIRSPGPATTRLMKFTSAFSSVGRLQTWPSGGGPLPQVLSCSAPAGGWKTTTSPTSGSPKRAPIRLTRTRWPISSVGTIDSDGIRYGLTRKAWMPSARPSATATIMISSSSEPEAEDPRDTLRLVFGSRGLGLRGTGRLGLRRRGHGLRGTGRLGVRRRGRGGLRLRRRGLGRLGVGQRLPIDRVAGHLGVRLGGGGRRGIVKQARLDDLLRAHVAALAYARTLADAAAQVVELGAPDVAAGGDLDPLDLRRVHGERALDADAEGLLADRERLAHPLALALDHDALEHLRPAPRPLDHLEVHAHPVAGLELRHAPELRALEAVDDGAHGEEKSRESQGGC